MSVPRLSSAYDSRISEFLGDRDPVWVELTFLALVWAIVIGVEEYTKLTPPDSLLVGLLYATFVPIATIKARGVFRAHTTLDREASDVLAAIIGPFHAVVVGIGYIFIDSQNPQWRFFWLAAIIVFIGSQYAELLTPVDPDSYVKIILDVLLVTASTFVTAVFVFIPGFFLMQDYFPFSPRLLAATAVFLSIPTTVLWRSHQLLASS